MPMATKGKMASQVITARVWIDGGAGGKFRVAVSVEPVSQAIAGPEAVSMSSPTG
jgi:hypothetical protein